MMKHTQNSLKDTEMSVGTNLKYLISLPTFAFFQDTLPPQKADFQQNLGVKLSAGRREGWREGVLRFGFPSRYPHSDLSGNKSKHCPQSDFSLPFPAEEGRDTEALWAPDIQPGSTCHK